MAGILTRLEMATEVLDNLARSSLSSTRNSTSLSTMAIRWLDRAHLTISRNHDLLFKVCTASTLANLQQYSFPSNINGIYSLRLEDGLNSIKLELVMPWEFDKLVPKPDAMTTGRPNFYIPYKTTNTFELFRIPDQTYTLRLRYSCWPNRLTLDNQVSDYSYMDDVIVAFATSLGFFWLQEYADAKEWKEQAFGLLKLAIETEENSFPDWAPKGRGFNAYSTQAFGEYYANPFFINDPSTRN